MTVHRLSKLRPAKPVVLPESWLRASKTFGFPQPKTWTAFELWGRGHTSYVMLIGDNRLRLNVSLDHTFANRAAARAWAVAFCAGLGRDIPERPKRWRPPAELSAGVGAISDEGTLPPDTPSLPNPSNTLTGE